MSIKLMTKAWDLNLKSNEKLVLIAMADHANDDGDCYPSVTKISTKCGMTRQGIIGIINRLISYGYVKKESRLRDNGSQTSNIYYLDFDSVKIVDSVNEVDGGGKGSLQGGVNEVDGGGKPALHLEPSLNHQLEPSLNKSIITNDYFNLFWDAYPRKTEKKEAKKAWDKAKDKPNIEVILKAVAMYKLTEEVRKGFIKYPTTWINKGCWHDEVQLSDYDKGVAVQTHTGMSAADTLAIQLEQAQREWEEENGEVR